MDFLERHNSKYSIKEMIDEIANFPELLETKHIVEFLANPITKDRKELVELYIGRRGGIICHYKLDKDDICFFRFFLTDGEESFEEMETSFRIALAMLTEDENIEDLEDLLEKGGY